MEHSVRTLGTLSMLLLTATCEGGVGGSIDSTLALVIGGSSLTALLLMAGVWQKREADLRALSRAFTMMACLAHASREREAELRVLSLTDPLTRLANRRRFATELSEEVARAKRSRRPVSLLMCDVDHFKKVNDTYGHSVGDEVLREIAEVISGCARSGIDTPARVGGEEFAVVVAETDLEGARMLAERIRRAVTTCSFHRNGTSFGVTLSIGVISHEGEGLDCESLLEAADSLLYRAKRSGRDRIEAAALSDIVSLCIAS